MRVLSGYFRIFVVGVFLNFVWEMAQAPLYQPMGTFWHATVRCAMASLGDELIIILIALLGSLVSRSPDWWVRSQTRSYVAAAAGGLVIAIVVERWGLDTGRWTYGSRMPVLPGTDLGLSPLTQMTVLVPLTFYAATIWHGHAKEIDRG
jgi:hypothetical protein